MNLQIERGYVELMVNEFPELSLLSEQLKFGNRAEVPFQRLSSQQLGYLRNLYEDAGPRMAGQAAQLANLEDAVNDPGVRYSEDDLEQLVPDIAEFLLKDAIRGWLFKADATGRPTPYLVSRIDFTPPGEEENGRILLDLKANAMAKIVTVNLIIRSRDIVAEIFAAKGFLKETEALIAAYDRSAVRFFDWRSDYGRQFNARGTGIFAEDPSASHRNTDWSRKNRVVLSSGGGWARLVNDEEILKERALSLDLPGDILGKYLSKAGRSTRFDEKVEGATETLREAIPEKLFTEVPVHGYILLFHLDLHHHLWGAVMLIDEADVYLKRRDDNIAANAVVGVFLRVLEYFNGLLFLTTNRVDDIDEVIVSRSIALIKYHPPELEDRRKIWAVMVEQFGLDIDDHLLDRLAEIYPQASGREIKGLTKLVAKYCHHKAVAPTLEVFMRCCVFRGMEPVGVQP